jgi:hypothetical protein
MCRLAPARSKKASNKERLSPIGEPRCPLLDVTVSIHIADNRQNLVLMHPSMSYTGALPSLRISSKHLGVRQHTTEQRILPHPWHDSWAKLHCQTRVRRKHSTCARPGLRFPPARGATSTGYDNTPRFNVQIQACELCLTSLFPQRCHVRCTASPPKLAPNVARPRFNTQTLVVGEHFHSTFTLQPTVRGRPLSGAVASGTCGPRCHMQCCGLFTSAVRVACLARTPVLGSMVCMAT